MSSARAVTAGVDEDQAWSSEALCSSRQAPDALTYISLSQTVREIERASEGERKGMGWRWGVGGWGLKREGEGA